MQDEPDSRRHARWLPATVGLLGLLILIPNMLDDATRDANVRCVRALGKGECTIRLGWLLRSYEWTIPPGELLGTSVECGQGGVFDSGCAGYLDLLGGSEELGQVDKDNFDEFSGAVAGFINEPSQGDLDVSLGPARVALFGLAVTLLVCLGLIGSFEFTELDVDDERRVLRLRTRGLLRWADLEIPIEDIANVAVERLPAGRDREEPNAIVWVQRHGREALRVGRSGEASAVALAAWIRERIARRPSGRG